MYRLGFVRKYLVAVEIYIVQHTNTMLENKSITINGSEVDLGGTVITGYTNGISGSNINKITYGTNITPPSSGNSAGDIYIQY